MRHVSSREFLPQSKATCLLQKVKMKNYEAQCGDTRLASPTERAEMAAGPHLPLLAVLVAGEAQVEKCFPKLFKSLSQVFLGHKPSKAFHRKAISARFRNKKEAMYPARARLVDVEDLHWSSSVLTSQQITLSLWASLSSSVEGGSEPGDQVLLNRPP